MFLTSLVVDFESPIDMNLFRVNNPYFREGSDIVLAASSIERNAIKYKFNGTIHVAAYQKGGDNETLTKISGMKK